MNGEGVEMAKLADIAYGFVFKKFQKSNFFGHPVVDQQIHFLETEQRLCRKLVELMEGFLRMENKTKISPTHQMAAQKHISKMKEGHFQEYYKYCRNYKKEKEEEKRSQGCCQLLHIIETQLNYLLIICTFVALNSQS